VYSSAKFLKPLYNLRMALAFTSHMLVIGRDKILSPSYHQCKVQGRLEAKKKPWQTKRNLLIFKAISESLQLV
jgi:hypothetical protein